MVVAIIALLAALSGSAYALSINTVGPRQIKSKAVTSAKLADEAVTGAKVANHSLTGADIELSALGTVPDATHVDNAGNAATVDGHPAVCPGGTTLIRGVCFDSVASGPVTGVQTAAEECANRGGYLPTPEKLLRTRAVLELGDGNGTHAEFTDSYYANTSGGEYATSVVSEAGEKSVLAENEKHERVGTFQFICSYPLVR
jgi:hypothetical protein